ncbi:MAG TPA: hypothetical protein VHW24_04350 [Bryobacteraceae bacterium]|nr:hypothetical protein [Bryobacteraceae bacterium]
MIAAILRAQFLTMRLGRGRRRALRAIPTILWYAFWVVVSLMACILAKYAEEPMLRRYLPLAYLAVTLYWQLMPLLTASMGRSLDLKKLAMYPVPHARLFAVDTLLCFTSSIEMALVIAGGSIGLMMRWGFTAAPGVILAGIIFLAFNSLLASGTRSIIGRLMSRRRVREVVILSTTCLWVGARFFVQMGVHSKWLGPFADASRGRGYPWSAASALASGSFFSLITLILWTLVALVFGRWQFERNLRFDVTAAQAQILRPMDSRRRKWTDLFYRLPGALWRDPLAAILEKELRSLIRTPRFRMVFVMGFTIGIVTLLPLVMSHGAAPKRPSSYFLVMVAIYALTLLGQVTYWNSFGFDGSATMFYFAAPQPMMQVFIAKNIAALIFVFLDVGIVSVVVTLSHLGGGWQQFWETMLAIGVCSLYLFGLGNMSSVNYPRVLNAERVTRGSGSGKGQGMLLLLYPVTLLPVGLAYVARWALNSEVAFLVVLGLSAAIGGAVYWIGLDSAVIAAYRKREEMLGELSKGDGPVAAE